MISTHKNIFTRLKKGEYQDLMSKDNTCKRSICAKKTSIGGQALMEGIMMRGPEVTAMAVRNTQGEIIIEKFPTQTKKRGKFFKLPIIRGLFNYIDSMTVGIKCLMRSAEISGLEEAEEELKREKAAKKAEKEAKKAAKKGVDIPDVSEETERSADDKNNSALTAIVMTVGTVLGVLLSIGLFFVLPTFIFAGLASIIPALKPENNFSASLIQSVIEGVIKLILIVGYMALMTLMKDIRRTFQFHGAEHKTIFCYEAGLELTVDNVRKQKRFHPRCGTSFLILMILVSIFIGFFITPFYILVLGENTINDLGPALMNVIRSLTKIILIPLIVGIGYELIKIAGKHDNVFTRIISAPGVWLQHITVLEPDDSMIECAIASVKEVIPNDESDNW